MPARSWPSWRSVSRGQGAGIEFSAYVAELVRTAKVKLNEKVFE